MNTLKERSNVHPQSNGIAVVRALAKARVGDEQALRWLMDQSKLGNLAALKALEDYERTQVRSN